MILKITKKPKFWKDSWPLEIPVVNGKHYKDYDIDVDKMDKTIYRDMIDTLLIDQAKYGKTDRLPIGFNRPLPDGIEIIQ